MSDSPFVASIGVVAGVGGVNREPIDTANVQTSRTGDGVFVFEPQLVGQMKITRFLRVGVDLGYRLVAGADSVPAADLRGVANGFHVQVGWF